MAEKGKNPIATGELSKMVAELEKASRGRKSVFGNTDQTLRRQDRSLAGAEAGILLGASRLDALAELTEGQMTRATQKVSSEETEVQKALATAYNAGSEEIKEAVEDYSRRLSELYWQSTQVSVGMGDEGKKLLVNKYIPTVDLLIEAISNDPLFNTERTRKLFQAPLLAYANKIKGLLEDRTGLFSRLASSAKSLIRSDVVAGVLAGAASKNVLVALAAFAYKGRKRSNTYASRLAVEQQGLGLRKTIMGRAMARQDRLSERASSIGGASSIRSSSLAPSGDSAGESASMGSGGGGGKSVEKILLQHTVLLEKIYGVLNGSLKLQQQQLAAQQEADEEADLKAKDTATRLIGADTAKEKPKGFIEKVIDLGKNFISNTVLPILKNVGPILESPAMLATGAGGAYQGAKWALNTYSGLTGDTEYKPFRNTLNETATNLGLPQKASDVLIGPKKDVSFGERMASGAVNSATRLPAMAPSAIKAGGNFILDLATRPGASSKFTNAVETATKVVEKVSPTIGKVANSGVGRLAGRFGGFALRSIGFAGRAMEGAAAYNSWKKFREARAKEGNSFLGSPETWLRAVQVGAHAAGVAPGLAGILGTTIGAGMDYIIDRNYEVATNQSQTATQIQIPKFDAKKAGDFSTREGRGAYIQQQLLSAGYSAEQTQGIMANLQSENYGFDPATPGDNGNAIGIAQWNGPRKNQVLAYQQSRSGVHPLQAQTEFLVGELAQYGLSPNKLSASANEAAQDILFKFEKPRVQFAQQRSAQYAQAFGAPTLTASTSTPASSTPEQQGRGMTTQGLSYDRQAQSAAMSGVNYLIQLATSNQTAVNGGSGTSPITPPVDITPTLRAILT